MLDGLSRPVGASVGLFLTAMMLASVATPVAANVFSCSGYADADASERMQVSIIPHPKRSITAEWQPPSVGIGPVELTLSYSGGDEDAPGRLEGIRAEGELDRKAAGDARAGKIALDVERGPTWSAEWVADSILNLETMDDDPAVSVVFASRPGFGEAGASPDRLGQLGSWSARLTATDPDGLQFSDRKYEFGAVVQRDELYRTALARAQAALDGHSETCRVGAHTMCECSG